MKTDPDTLVEVGETDAEALAARDPSASSRARLLAAAREPSRRWAPLFDRLSALFDLGEPALVALAERAAQPGEWSPGPLPGVRLFHLDPGPAVANADAGLVRVEAGLTFPRHRHLGEERTLILEGVAEQDDGVVHRPGDRLTQAPGSSHSFVVRGDAPLVYALVLFEGIELDGQLFGRRSR